jgi:hypothetical protein
MSAADRLGIATTVVKRLAALALLATLFLPLARCEGVRSADAPPGAVPREELMVAIDLVDLAEPATLVIPLIFCWPLLLMALARAWRGAQRLALFEPLLAAGTLWYLWQITVDWGEVLWAGYLALGAAGAYLAAALLSLPAALARWRRPGAG